MSGVIILITAKTCGHCINFKTHILNPLKSKIETITNLSFVHYDLETMNIKNESVYEEIKYLEKFIFGFPTLLYLPKSSVVENITKGIDLYSIEVVNGEIVYNDKEKRSPSFKNRSMSIDEIINWSMANLNKKIENVQKVETITNNNTSNYRIKLVDGSKVLFDDNIRAQTADKIISNLKKI